VERLPTLLSFKGEEPSDEFDFYFNTFYNARRPVIMAVEKGWKPLTDVYETDCEIVIIIDIAGISTSDIKLTLHRDVLTVRGIRHEHPNTEKRHYYKMEIDFGPFERKIDLPARIDPERATKRYYQGFLEVRLPKLEPVSLASEHPEIDL